MSHHDVIVVGAGLAGLTAAVRLAEDGARVLVLAKGVGATHLSGGTIDVFGYGPERVERPAEAIAALVDAQPGHPYTLLGADAVAAAIDWFKARIAAGPLGPYAYTGDAEQNLLLPTAAGVSRPSAVVPETMAGGDLRRDAAICIVGFRALKDFHPALAADTLRRTGVQARSVALELVPEGRADVNALGFARAFDAPASGPTSPGGSPVSSGPGSALRFRPSSASPTRTACGPSSRIGSAAPCSRFRRCPRRSRACASTGACTRRCAGRCSLQRRWCRFQPASRIRCRFAIASFD